MGKVARTISWLWETFFLEESLGTVGGLLALRATSLVISTLPACSTSLEGLLGEGRALAGMSLLGSVSLEVVSTLEPEELDARIVGG